MRVEAADAHGVLGGELPLVRVRHLVRGVAQRLALQHAHAELRGPRGEGRHWPKPVDEALRVDEHEVLYGFRDVEREVNRDRASERGPHERDRPSAELLAPERLEVCAFLLRPHARRGGRVCEPPSNEVDGVRLDAPCVEQGHQPSELQAAAVEPVQEHQRRHILRRCVRRAHHARRDPRLPALRPQLDPSHVPRHVPRRRFLDLRHVRGRYERRELPGLPRTPRRPHHKPAPRPPQTSRSRRQVTARREQRHHEPNDRSTSNQWWDRWSGGGRREGGSQNPTLIKAIRRIPPLGSDFKVDMK